MERTWDISLRSFVEFRMYYVVWEVVVSHLIFPHGSSFPSRNTSCSESWHRPWLYYLSLSFSTAWLWGIAYNILSSIPDIKHETFILIPTPTPNPTPNSSLLTQLYSFYIPIHPSSPSLPFQSQSPVSYHIIALPVYQFYTRLQHRDLGSNIVVINCYLCYTSWSYSTTLTAGPSSRYSYAVGVSMHM